MAHGKHLAAAANLVSHYPTLRSQAAPHRRLSAAVPRPRPRRSGDLATDFAARSPFRRGRRRHRHHPVRGGADRPVHGAALSAEIRCANSGRRRAIPHAPSVRPMRSPCGLRAGTCARLGKVEQRYVEAAPTRLLAALVFRPILNKIGFDQLELVVCGGAPLCQRKRRRCGTCTGSTSSKCMVRPKTAGGIIAGQRGPFPAPGDVGTPAFGLECALVGRRRSAGPQSGYFRRLLAQ